MKLLAKEKKESYKNAKIYYIYCFLEYTNFKDDLIRYKCFCCSKNEQKKFDEKLKERFFNAYKVSHHDNNKFILLLRKGVFFIDDWEKFSETLLPEKENFYSHLNMEYITDTDCVHTHTKKKKVKFYDLYVQSNTLLLADVFENFWNIYLKIYELDPRKPLSALESALQAALKRKK